MEIGLLMLTVGFSVDPNIPAHTKLILSVDFLKSIPIATWGFNLSIMQIS